VLQSIIMKRSILSAAVVFLYLLLVVSLFFIGRDSLLVIYSFFGIVNDNILHVPAFFVMAFLVRLMFSSRIFKVKDPLIWCSVVAIVLGIVLELAHLYVPSRTFNPVDMALNMVGIVLYIAVDFLVERHLVGIVHPVAQDI